MPTPEEIDKKMQDAAKKLQSPAGAAKTDAKIAEVELRKEMSPRGEAARQKYLKRGRIPPQ